MAPLRKIYIDDHRGYIPQARCPICSSDDFQQTFFSGHINTKFTITSAIAVFGDQLFESRMRYCTHCQFGYFIPRPSLDQLNSFYHLGGGALTTQPDDFYVRRIDSFDSQLNHLILFSYFEKSNLLSPFAIENKRGLEVGPGFSPSIRFFQRLGLEYHTSEIGKDSISFLERQYSAINHVDCRGFSNYFDLILSKDCLEHSHDPLSALTGC